MEFFDPRRTRDIDLYSPLTSKQKVFVKELAEGAPTKEASEKAGYASPSTALSSLRVSKVANKALLSLLNRKISEERIVATLEEGLQATHSTKYGEEPDHSVRHQYLDTVLKLRDAYPKKNEIIIDEESYELRLRKIRDIEVTALPKEAEIIEAEIITDDPSR